MRYIIGCVIILLVLLIYFSWHSTNIWSEYYYFDNNGTTMIHPEVMREINRCSHLGNPSASYATEARNVIANSSAAVLSWVQSPSYKTIFTSGGSESINTIINSIVSEHTIPHIITSMAEHTTTLECCKKLEILGRASVTYVSSNPFIDPDEVVAAITPNTVLVTLIHGNNETGVLNNVETICAKVKEIKPGVIFHIDAVQTFGKYSIPMNKWGIDALSFSGHKFNAGSGVGGLILAPHIHIEYPIICGTQQGRARGGTEDVASIAGLATGLRIASTNRDKKNAAMRDCVAYIWNYLTQHTPAGYSVHLITPIDMNQSSSNTLDGPRPPVCTPNTLMFYVLKKGAGVCNVKMKRALQNMGYIVSIGSACKTGSTYASHVVYALDITEEARKGILRVSVGDRTTKYECSKLARAIISLMK